MATRQLDNRDHCSYCGRPLLDDGAPERFGERFCSEGHAAELAAGVRAERIAVAARNEARGAPAEPHAGACAMPAASERSWSDSVKRAACWAAPLLLIVAIPLIWTGGWAAAGGSLLSVLALLACPLGMYFMMRGMMRMQPDGMASTDRDTEDRRA